MGKLLAVYDEADSIIFERQWSENALEENALDVTSGVASPKFLGCQKFGRGPKHLTLGEQHVFLYGTPLVKA